MSCMSTSLRVRLRESASALESFTLLCTLTLFPKRCNELTRVTPPLIPFSFSGAIAAIMDLMKTAAAGLTLAEYWVRTTSNPSPHHHTPTTELCHQASASATRNTPKLLPHRPPHQPRPHRLPVVQELMREIPDPRDLRFAARSGSALGCQKLLNRGADPNAAVRVMPYAWSMPCTTHGLL